MYRERLDLAVQVLYSQFNYILHCIVWGYAAHNNSWPISKGSIIYLQDPFIADKNDIISEMNG